MCFEPAILLRNGVYVRDCNRVSHEHATLINHKDNIEMSCGDVKIRVKSNRRIGCSLRMLCCRSLLAHKRNVSVFFSGIVLILTTLFMVFVSRRHNMQY